MPGPRQWSGCNAGQLGLWSLPDKSMGVIHEGRNYSVSAKKIIIASGAKENYMAFPGSIMPGVMGAGAAQTMVNVNRVLPGKRILMVGSGNVGLIVSYQLMQAGAEVVALVRELLRSEVMEFMQEKSGGQVFLFMWDIPLSVSMARKR